jgi:dihydrodipicolinate synthase/N-acetylneuraminate lyase
MGVANLFADACADILNAFKKGDIDRSRSLQLALIEINQTVTKRYGVPGLKAALDHAGLYGGPVRAPLLPVDERVRKEIGRIHDGFRHFYEEVSS